MRIAKDLRAATASRAPRWRWARRRTSRRWRRSASAATPARRTWCSPSTGPESALDAAERELAAPAAGAGGGRGGRSRRARSPRRAQLAGANVALISVPGEYAALEAHRALTAGHARLPLLRPRLRRGRGRAQAPRRGARAARHGPGLRHRDARARSGSASPTSCARARSGSSPPPARARRRPRSCSTAPGVGVSQIIGVGGRDLSADGRRDHVPRGDADARRRRRRPTRCCCVSKPPAREVVQRLGEVDVGGKRVVAAFVGWDGGDAPFEVHPTLEAGAFAAARRAAARRRRARGRRSTRSAPAGGCSACTPAARSRTRR